MLAERQRMCLTGTSHMICTRHFRRTILASAIAVLLAAPAARAHLLYLDLNTGFVVGFGTGAGTYNWADGPWTTSFTGTGSTLALALSAFSTVTADVANGRTAIINAAVSGGSPTI